MQAHGFRFSFTPLSEVLFTFPSRYWFAIGLSVVFSLGGWCRQIRTGLLRPRPTQGTARPAEHFGYAAFTRSGRPFQAVPLCSTQCHVAALQPRRRLDGTGLGSSAFARRYSRNHCCFLFLRVLRCFSSPRRPPIRDGAPSGAPGCPIRTPADQRPFAPPRGFSQLVTSFLASESPGILRAPLTDFLVSSATPP